MTRSIGTLPYEALSYHGARQQLTSKPQQNSKLKNSFRGIARLTTALASKDNLAGGVRVSQLLPHVSALPGHEHIFLVGPDKIPVLTFWGFKNPGELDRAPLPLHVSGNGYIYRGSTTSYN